VQGEGGDSEGKSEHRRINVLAWDLP
jgi:hypothetical protein